MLLVCPGADYVCVSKVWCVCVVSPLPSLHPVPGPPTAPEPPTLSCVGAGRRVRAISRHLTPPPATGGSPSLLRTAGYDNSFKYLALDDKTFYGKTWIEKNIKSWFRRGKMEIPGVTCLYQILVLSVLVSLITQTTGLRWEKNN